MSTIAPIYAIQRVLSVAQAVPFIGVAPSMVKGLLSVAQATTGVALVILGTPLAFWGVNLGYWVIKEGGDHLEMGLKGFLYAGGSAISLGFGGLAIETLCVDCSKC